MVDRWPVLVDFESSIVDEEATMRIAAGPPRGPATFHRLPRRLRAWWKPPNRVAERNTQILLSLLPHDSPSVLVIGGGTVGNGVDALYEQGHLRLIAFDVYASPTTQFIADAHRIPLAAESVDAVVVQAVLEHVLRPDDVVREIERVLRPHGLVYAETPFLQQVHAGAYDFTRFTSSGHRYLFRRFEEIDAGPVAGPGTQLLWSVDHLVRGLTRSHTAGKVARMLCLWLRQLDRFVGPAFAMDSGSAYFFLGRRSRRELTPQEIAAYYRGAQRFALGER